jgi:hypothetical protein
MYLTENFTLILKKKNDSYFRSLFFPIHHSIYHGYNGNQTYNQWQFSSDYGYAKTKINLFQGKVIKYIIFFFNKNLTKLLVFII